MYPRAGDGDGEGRAAERLSATPPRFLQGLSPDLLSCFTARLAQGVASALIMGATSSLAREEPMAGAEAVGGAEGWRWRGVRRVGGRGRDGKGGCLEDGSQ